MSRVTVRLPDSLHRQLIAMAEQENISLNQFIVSALTQYVMQPSSWIELRRDDANRQQTAFEALRRQLRQGAPADILEALATREPGEPDPVLLTPSGLQLRARLDEALKERLAG